MRQELIELHKEHVGETDKEKTDIELMFELMKELVRRIEEQENHTHNIR